MFSIFPALFHLKRSIADLVLDFRAVTAGRMLSSTFGLAATKKNFRCVFSSNWAAANAHVLARAPPR
jgi:hypothetical protein